MNRSTLIPSNSNNAGHANTASMSQTIRAFSQRSTLDQLCDKKQYRDIQSSLDEHDNLDRLRNLRPRQSYHEPRNQIHVPCISIEESPFKRTAKQQQLKAHDSHQQGFTRRQLEFYQQPNEWSDRHSSFINKNVSIKVKEIKSSFPSSNLEQKSNQGNTFRKTENQETFPTSSYLNLSPSPKLHEHSNNNMSQQQKANTQINHPFSTHTTTNLSSSAFEEITLRSAAKSLSKPPTLLSESVHVSMPIAPTTPAIPISIQFSFSEKKQPQQYQQFSHHEKTHSYDSSIHPNHNHSHGPFNNQHDQIGANKRSNPYDDITYRPYQQANQSNRQFEQQKNIHQISQQEFNKIPESQQERQLNFHQLKLQKCASIQSNEITGEEDRHFPKIDMPHRLMSEPVVHGEDENVLYTLVKREFTFHDKHISKEEIWKLVNSHVPLNVKDETRVACAHKEGGKECADKKIRNCLRDIGKEIIKQVGSKILSGSFNLTQISFPIRAMIPRTALEKALYSTILFPLYVNKAATTTNYVERVKYLICATLGNFYVNLGFLKPLNPILGETCSGYYPDGTKLYAEQISHHPPVSYFTVYGPNNSYLMYGNYNFESNAGLNSLKLKNSGSRHIRFHDGQQITYSFAKEEYSGSFWGTMKVESKGVIKFSDAANRITAEISISSVKKKPSDYLQGTIKVGDTIVANCHGSYMGFIEFDSQRYWDSKHVIPFEPVIVCSDIGSDHSKRLDKQALIEGNVQDAQRYKEELEILQRSDAKLRKSAKEGREKLAKKNKKKNEN